MMNWIYCKATTLIITWAVVMMAGCTSPPKQPVEFTIAEAGATRPTAAVGPEGAVYVAWVGREEEKVNVYLAYRSPGSKAFSTPVRVNDRPGDAAAHAQAPAQVAVGPEGTVYVAWISQTEVEGRRWPAADIRLARSTDGGRTFQPALTVNEATVIPTSQSFHNLAVGPEGTVYVSWLDSRAGDRVKRAQRTHGSGLPAGGHAHTAGTLSGTQLRVAHSRDGGKHFSKGVVVAQGTCQCCRTALDVGPEGTVYVVWRHLYEGQIRDMAVAHSTDGGRSFTTPVRVHIDNWHINGCPHAGPAVAVDGMGRVHISWYTGAKGKAGVYYAVAAGGGAPFGPARALVTGVPVSQVSAAGDGHGGVWMAWEDREAGGFRAATINGDVMDVWSETVPGSMPATAADGGIRVVAWQEDDQLKARVREFATTIP